MPDPSRVSYSSLRTFQTCQRKYYYEYVRRILPIGRRLALEFGSSWHEALSAYFKTQAVQPAVDTFNAHYEDSPDDTMRTRQTAKRMLQRYAEKYPTDSIELVADERWLELPIGSIGLYVMKIDKLVTWHGEPYIMEHKTTSGYQGITSSFLKSFKPNLQLRGYAKGVSTLVDPAYRSILVDIAWVGRGEPKSGEPFLRYEERVEDWELVEFMDTAEIVTAHIGARKDTSFASYTPDWSRCHDYGGCPYRPLCTAAPSIRERIIAEGYMEKPTREEAKDVVE